MKERTKFNIQLGLCVVAFGAMAIGLSFANKYKSFEQSKFKMIPVTY